MKTVAAALLLAGTLAAAGYFPPPDSQGGWRTLAQPAEIKRKAGIDLKPLDQAFALIQSATRNGGLLVVRHGWLVYERYFGRAYREARPNLASCGKTFTSIAVGMLMREHPQLFPEGLDQRVMTPRYLPPGAFPLNDPAKAEIRLGQLLSMTAGLRGNTPGIVDGRTVSIEPPGPDGWRAMVDATAFSVPMWCKPGAGFSYATVSPHLLSAMVRHISGMELAAFLEDRLAKPLGWGQWGFGYRRPEITHTPGGGGIALRATDMVRFAYLLLQEGRWGAHQVVPAAYVRQCLRPSPYNPHSPYSLQVELNSDAHVQGAPRDAAWKQGSGGHAFFVVPSLDLVVWKIGGRDDQYEFDPPSGPARAWKQTLGETESNLRTLELVVAACVR